MVEAPLRLRWLWYPRRRRHTISVCLSACLPLPLSLSVCLSLLVSRFGLASLLPTAPLPLVSCLRSRLKERGMRVMHLTDEVPCYTTYFPYRNVLSFMIGPLRVYPSISKDTWCVQHTHATIGGGSVCSQVYCCSCFNVTSRCFLPFSATAYPSISSLYSL